MAILKANGIEFTGGYGLSASKKTQTSGWFHYNHQFTGGHSYDTNWTDGSQYTPDWQIPARAMIFVYYYSPTRGDTDNWGGMYTNLNYRINSSSWEDCGHSGYVTRMRTSSYSISKHTGFAVFNMSSKTSDFTIGFKINYRSYDNSGNINDNGEDNGNAGDRTGGNWAFRKNIVVTGYGVDT